MDNHVENDKPSSSKTTVTKTDFVESIKAFISESMVEGFRQKSGTPNENIVQNYFSVALLNVF